MKKFVSAYLIIMIILCSGCKKEISAFAPGESVTPDLFSEITALPETDTPETDAPMTDTPESTPEVTPAPTPKPTQKSAPAPTPYDSNTRPISKDSTVVLSAKYGYYEMMSDVNMLLEKYPQYLSRESLGTSEFGREIPIIIMGKKDSPKKILIVASSHAREYANSAIIMKTIENYCENMKTASFDGVNYIDLIEQTSKWFVPVHNPDGVEISINGFNSVPDSYKNTVRDIFNRSVKKKYLSSGNYTKWKANGLGYDLNRDYGIGGKEKTKEYTPMSENFGGDFQSKEGRLIASLIREKDFLTVTSYHSCGNIIYWGFYATGEFKEQCRSMAEAIKNLNGYRLVEDTQKSEKDYAYLGLKDWFMKEYKRPGFTIETGGGSAPVSLSELKKAYNKNVQIPALLLHYEYKSEQ